MIQARACSLLFSNHAGEQKDRHITNNCEHDWDQMVAIGVERGVLSLGFTWKHWKAGMCPYAVPVGFQQHAHFNNRVFPCPLWFQVTCTPTASPSLMSQVRGSSWQAISGPSCCPGNPASWLLAKWTENYGWSRLTGRNSLKLVLTAGEETSSSAASAIFEAYLLCQCWLKLGNKAQKLL